MEENEKNGFMLASYYQCNIMASFLLQVAALSVALFRAFNLTTRYNLLEISAPVLISIHSFR